MPHPVELKKKKKNPSLGFVSVKKNYLKVHQEIDRKASGIAFAQLQRAEMGKPPGRNAESFCVPFLV